jgi:hypothetical protein
MSEIGAMSADAQGRVNADTPSNPLPADRA